MATETRKCAHPSCECQVSGSDKYCSQSCKDRGANEIEIGCDCGHDACSVQAERVA